MNWIPVSEKLPDNQVIYYREFKGEKIIGIALFIHENIKYYIENGITHWMPLPEPPQR